MANKFHNNVKIGALASIEISMRGTDTVIGEGSVIDDFVKIKHVGGTGHVEIGKRVYINSGTVLYSGNGIIIGNDVMIGPNCNLVPANHEFGDSGKPMREQGFKPSRGGIVIEEDVWLGANVTVLDGAVIRRGCVVGANSLVSGELESYGVYAGSPARLIKKRKE